MTMCALSDTAVVERLDGVKQAGAILNRHQNLT